MEYITISDCALITQGRNVPKEKLNEEGKGLPYIVGASCLKNCRLDCKKFVEDYTKAEITQRGDIIISTVGTLGKVAINDIGDCVLSKHVCAVRFVPQITPEYGLICLLASLRNCIPPEECGKTGFSRKLDVAAIESCPLLLVAIDEQQMLVNRMIMIAQRFYAKPTENINVDNMLDDPILLAEWFKKQSKSLLNKQLKAVDGIVSILKESWEEHDNMPEQLNLFEKEFFT